MPPHTSTRSPHVYITATGKYYFFFSLSLFSFNPRQFLPFPLYIRCALRRTGYRYYVIDRRDRTSADYEGNRVKMRRFERVILAKNRVCGGGDLLGLHPAHVIPWASGRNGRRWTRKVVSLGGGSNGVHVCSHNIRRLIDSLPFPVYNRPAVAISCAELFTHASFRSAPPPLPIFDRLWLFMRRGEAVK